jgi:hypothetical protein
MEAVMVTVKVEILNGDRKVGAMVKALAVEVSGYPAVKGATKEFLDRNGYYELTFPSEAKAAQFRAAVGAYLPQVATVK